MYTERNSVVIKDRERDVKVWKNVNVYVKWGWNQSPFDINSVLFHFDDFNYGRRSQPFNSAVFFTTYNKMKKIISHRRNSSNIQ